MSSLYYLNMKHITDYITEVKKAVYELPKDFEEKSMKILDEIQSLLPKSYPGYKTTQNEGYFVYNKYDLLRAPIENSLYKGNVDCLTFRILRDSSNMNTSLVKGAIESIFNVKINESVFDNNIDKDIPEYGWVNDVYNGLCKFFKTKDFSNISVGRCSEYSFSGKDFSKFRNYPTVEKEGYRVTLCGIDTSRLDGYYRNLPLIICIYEIKDPEKVASIKAQNDAMKPLDCDGRELMVGDKVAYVLRGELLVGDITKASQQQVTMGNIRVYADRCCLISRKNGKRIE